MENSFRLTTLRIYLPKFKGARGRSAIELDGPGSVSPRSAIAHPRRANARNPELYLPHYRKFPDVQSHIRGPARVHPGMTNALAFEQFVGDDLDAET